MAEPETQIKTLLDKNIVAIDENNFRYGIFHFSAPKNSKPVLKRLSFSGCVEKFAEHGIRKIFNGGTSFPVIIKNKTIEEITPEQIKDLIFNSIRNTTEPITFVYKGFEVCEDPEKLKDIFLAQSNLIFNSNYLQAVKEFDGIILRDTRDKANFFFENGVIEITNKEINKIEYSDIGEVYVWKSQIIPRKLSYTPDYSGSHIYKFILNVCENDGKRIKAMRSVIGYLLHNYSNESGGQVAIFIDQVLTDLKNPQGGTGKGVLMNAIKQLRVVVKIDGKKLNEKSQFMWQSITRTTQVVWLDDVKPKFDFSILHSTSTDGITVEKKFQDAMFFEPKDTPKFAITSNSMILGEGSTNRRRQHLNEFSDHYSKQIFSGIEEPIKAEHGCTFYSEDWNANEWNMFYSFMMDCTHDYLREGLATYQHVNIGANKLRQSTSEEFVKWAGTKNFKTGEIYFTKEQFNEFKTDDDADMVQKTFTGWLKQFATLQNWNFDRNRSNSISSFKFSAK